MKRKASIAFALACGLVCCASVFAYTQEVNASAQAARQEALARYGGDQVEVCVATRPIAAGETVTAANTVMRQWLVDLLPDGAVLNFSDVSGKQASAAIVAGEVLCQARFGASDDFVAVPQGMEAVSIELGLAQAVGGALEAGSLVDVYSAGASGAARIAAGVLVVHAADPANARQNVTLAVGPQHVAEVIATTQKSTLYLTLPSQSERSASDD